ncbi:MAG: hypothetical protein MI810_09430 [Flavobacteriales bacterium]|nr:hypothetical protein [Flavobacteriales bacterium]
MILFRIKKFLLVFIVSLVYSCNSEHLSLDPTPTDEYEICLVFDMDSSLTDSTLSLAQKHSTTSDEMWEISFYSTGEPFITHKFQGEQLIYECYLEEGQADLIDYYCLNAKGHIYEHHSVIPNRGIKRTLYYKYVFDEYDNPLEQKIVDNQGKIHKKTHFEYENQNLVYKEYDKVKEYYQYDSKNRLIKKEKAISDITSLVDSFTYKNNLLVQKTHSTVSRNHVFGTSYETYYYDENGRLIKELRKEPYSKTIDIRHFHYYQYDDAPDINSILERQRGM